MALELKLDSAKFRRNSRFYAVFLVVFIITAYLFYSTGIKFYTGISKTLKNTDELKKDTELLEVKISSLKSIKEGGVEDLNSLNISFQSEDPSLFMYSQLKKIALRNGVELRGISFSRGSVLKNVSVSVINLSVRGIKENVFTFISELGQTAPLSGLGGMSITDYVETGGVLEISMMIEVYYSPLPKELPDTKEVVNSLTKEEKDVYDTLIKLEVLSQANFTAQAANENIDDPFGVEVFNIQNEEE